MRHSAVHRDGVEMVQSAAGDPWPTPTPRVRDLFRQGAQLALDARPEWIEELQQAVLGSDLLKAAAEDPVLAEATRRSNLANLLHWAASNVHHPGRRVRPEIGPEVLETAREFVRRGIDSNGVDAYRTGSSVAWRRWMQICFGLTRDVDELRDLLEVSSLSITTFIDDTIAALGERIDAERTELTSGTLADRRAAVALLLEGAPIGRARAEAQLGHRLTGPHTAAVVWGDLETSPDALEAVAEALTRASGAPRRLTVVATAASSWIWLPIATAPTVDAVGRVLAEHRDVRVAIGRPGRDLEGFRRSHLDAVTTQQLLARLRSPRQLARYEDVHLVALVTGDPQAADEFVQETLGDLLHADVETRQTVLAWVREECSTTRAAARLFTHRNTVVRRLSRADSLLPRPLADDVLGVAVALEVLQWRGPAA